ncbi:diaminopimelate decarboxylase [Lactobacillus nasalidis]|uniref:Diaminopimelate decarboxylase n=1 Tax=Lactobacillus nasalidis TaxID=2797258 RepID=A0ABQ3W3R1_9LACO|nr:diaminopimelate decarboxylase [Lactobacillus nasalidis]GHV99352.1 diaminopimelate decarboxylase [Lactobacillus nasalidis]GHW01085.1 diaminopimelate decarboxylase [Lactobacillus nasalidis]
MQIGGVDALELAARYQTPLQVYDVGRIRQAIRAFKRVFEEEGVSYEVSYASKAFSCLAIYQVINEEGGHTDVVSGGELWTALKAGFPMSKVSFHGNNKSRSELELAVEHGVGVIIVDNFHEIDLLSQILEEKDAEAKVMLRVTPGISAHTNEYIQTGQVDSKFGFDMASGQADRALELVLANPRLQMAGVHAHIGSQIFDVRGFVGCAEKLCQLAEDWRDKYGYETEILNVGGGFGIHYTDQDHPLPAEEFVRAIVKAVKRQCQEKGLELPEIWIEPGRSIVGQAGWSLYTVGSRKDLPGYPSYVALDGGMGDNIRPALYQAEYSAVVADRPQAEAEEVVNLVGKYCESGDVLIKSCPLPKTEPGDVVALLSTGAYGYSMASNYNRNPRPAVVFAENGQAKLVIKRESYDDLLVLDLKY